MNKTQQKIYIQAKERWDAIAKPIDSLGVFEDMVARLCAIAGTENPGDYKRRALLTLCADHGVVAEGVTQTDSGVTKVVAENIAHGCSGVNYMAQTAGVDVYAVDIGMLGEPYPDASFGMGHMINRKVQAGTGNLAKEPAMSMETCDRAIEAGKELVRECKEKGYEILAVGEMGIGNTTPTSALLAALLELPAEAVTGRGAGLDDAGLIRKQHVITQALARVEQLDDAGLERKQRVTAQALARAEQMEDAGQARKMLSDASVKRLLAELGGLEIAGMVGVFLGAKEYAIPVVLDGAITCVAALVAQQLEPDITDYLLASHVSEEVSGRLALNALGLPAVIHGRLCLGEGSGAVMLFPLLDMALSVYKHMGTFEELSIEAYSRNGKPIDAEAD